MTARNTSNAVCEISRIPKRSTMREFRYAAMPMKMAHSANMLGINFGAVEYLGKDLRHHARRRP